MPRKSLAGGYPQKTSESAAGVSLTRPEREFLLLLKDRNHDREELIEVGMRLGMDEGMVRYIEEWVTFLGVHWLASEGAEYDAMEGARVFRNPVVSRIINEAAELGICCGTVPTKDEVCMFLGQQMRSGRLDCGMRMRAAEVLSKLMGYYPDGAGKGLSGVNIQIVNPYPGETRVVMAGSGVGGSDGLS